MLILDSLTEKGSPILPLHCQSENARLQLVLSFCTNCPNREFSNVHFSGCDGKGLNLVLGLPIVPPRWSPELTHL
ncbi:Uncharacterised protein [Vibrio cholerae]|nr:Uncharacterised protein [Vibrio cholerae]CSB78986.1 Uncharacterised protein [Vibrio cholerae]CSD06259.1 Uncharacterised protein [Vibrio cholerae]CSI50347.1 Uncharacterised protein [Vibrio cholerae]